MTWMRMGVRACRALCVCVIGRQGARLSSELGDAALAHIVTCAPRVPVTTDNQQQETCSCHLYGWTGCILLPSTTA